MIQYVRGQTRDKWWDWHADRHEAALPTRAGQDHDQHHQASHFGPTHGREGKSQRQSTILAITEVHPHREYKQHDDSSHQAQSYEDKNRLLYTHAATRHSLQQPLPQERKTPFLRPRRTRTLKAKDPELDLRPNTIAIGKRYEKHTSITRLKMAASATT